MRARKPMPVGTTRNKRQVARRRKGMHGRSIL